MKESEDRSEAAQNGCATYVDPVILFLPTAFSETFAIFENLLDIMGRVFNIAAG